MPKRINYDDLDTITQINISEAKNPSKPTPPPGDYVTTKPDGETVKFRVRRDGGIELSTAKSYRQKNARHDVYLKFIEDATKENVLGIPVRREVVRPQIKQATRRELGELVRY